MNVLQAKYGTASNSLDDGVLIQTDTIGWVASSVRDAPYSGGAWEALQAWIGQGNSIGAYEPPEGE